MSKKTIDGVPRSTLELLLGDKPDYPSAAWKELRALLDSPVPVVDGEQPAPVSCPGDGVGPCKKCPAAKPQGEPVAMHSCGIDKGYDYCARCGK